MSKKEIELAPATHTHTHRNEIKFSGGANATNDEQHEF